MIKSKPCGAAIQYDKRMRTCGRTKGHKGWHRWGIWWRELIIPAKRASNRRSNLRKDYSDRNKHMNKARKNMSKHIAGKSAGRGK